MKANSDKSKQSNKATRRVLAGVLCGASVLSLVLSLVMPPISQAIANDAQTVSTEETVMGGGSSSESTDVDNTNNGDTGNQNSDETEGDETGDESQPEEQPEEEQQNEGTTTSDGETVAAVAENEQAKTASDEMINSASKLKEKLENASGTANFMLTENIDLTNDNDNNKTIQLDNDGSNITLDLNGHKIKYASNGQPLFNITGGATLTVKDGTQTAPTETSVNQEKMNGNLASIECDASNIPNKLTYYVTESVAKGTGTTEITGTTEVPGTTETLKEYKVDIKGAIVACGDHANLKLVNLFKTDGKVGTFNLESGAITQQQNSKDQNNSVNNRVSSLVYAEEDSTVNMSGGYICGATSMDHGAGIELGIKNGKGATLNLTGGVIAGNYAPEGGGVYADGSTINMTGDTTGGTISGNGTFEDRSGFGAGICAKDSMVTILNGYITNNKYQHYDESHKGNGCHGGGGIAAFSKYSGQRKGSLVISGGYITGNYSAEAGGGVYAGAWNQALSGFTFSGGIIASNVAQNSEGGGIRISAPTESVFNVPIGTKAYITNNKTNTDNDWGGGGVFVQGGDDGGVQPASLKIYNALITKNLAWGFGGGFAACPTGKTAITDTNGIAVFGNTDKDGEHRSKGSHSKTADADEINGGQITDNFKTAGHQDLFLIRGDNNNQYIAAVTGQMLGGGAANWTGTIDKTPTFIGKYEGAQARYMIGLRSDSSVDDQNVAKGLASLYITGNESNVHGGGIMTNGNVVAGSTTEVKVYPKMKLNGIKVLEGGSLEGNDFNFQLLKQNEIKDKSGRVTGYTVPSFDANGNLHLNGCSVVDTAANAKNGSFSFNLSEVYADADLVYYLVEVPGTDKDVNYDKTIYKIDPTVTEDPTKTHDVLGIKYTYYTVSNVEITKMFDDKTETSDVTPTSEDGVACVALTGGATFTNTPYTSDGSWTPKATKVVKGGEMKKFTLEFADNENFTGDSVKTVSTTAGGDNPQPQDFPTINYTLDSLKQSETDVPGRGASKTFTYYMCEKNDSSIFSHYKFDKSVYRFKVVATDNTKGGIDCAVTYRKGYVDSEGEWINDDTTDHHLTDDSTPTFTNTYSTSLPLSGMSGVTLTYLAGAAVLCAAAAWMHIRRKANAKGGERRE